jgi:hypothetical protein
VMLEIVRGCWKQFSGTGKGSVMLGTVQGYWQKVLNLGKQLNDPGNGSVVLDAAMLETVSVMLASV